MAASGSKVLVWDGRRGGAPIVLNDDRIGAIEALALGADARWIAVGGKDGTVWLRDREANDAVRLLGRHVHGPVNSIRFSADGSRLVSAGDDGVAMIWSTDSQATPVPLDAGVAGLRLRDASFSHSGQRIATAGSDHIVRVWQIDGQRTPGIFTELPARRGTGSAHESTIAAVVFDPASEDLLATAGVLDKVIKVWDIRHPIYARTDIPTFHTGPLTALQFGPNEMLVSASEDKTVKVWSAASGKQLANLTGHTGVVTSVALSTDGLRLVSGSADKSVRLWNTLSGAQRASATPNAEGTSNRKRALYSATFSGSLERAVVGGLDEAARTWMWRTGQMARPVKLKGPVWKLTGSSGSNAVTAFAGGVTLQTWDASRDGAQATVAMTLYSKASSFEVHPTDPSRALVGYRNGRAAIVRLDRGTSEHEWTAHAEKPHGEEVLAVAWSADGKWVLTAGSLATKVWDVASLESAAGGAVQPNSQFLQSAITAAALSADSKYAAIGTEDGNVLVWDWQSGRNPLQVTEHSGLKVRALSFSPDGKYLAAGGGDPAVWVWESQTGQLLEQLQGHTDDVAAVAFGSDNRTLLTASYDGSTRVFECQLCGTLTQLLALAQSRLEK